MPKWSEVLSTEQHLERDGFAVLDSLLDEGELRKCTAALLAKGEQASRRLLEEVLWHEIATLMTARAPTLSGFRPILATYFPKSKTNNWFVALHRDWVLPTGPFATHWNFQKLTTKEGLSFGRAPLKLLDQCTALRLQLSKGSEGGLALCPGSHRLANVSAPQHHKTIEPMVKRGGGLLMKPLIIHASPKIRAESSLRRIVHVVYAPEDTLA